MILRTIFNNYTQQKIFNRQGYIVIPGFFSAKQIEALQHIYEQTKTGALPNSNFFTTHWVSDRDYRRAIHAGVSDILNEHITPLFNNYKSILGYFLTKTPGANNEVTLHRDWSIVDENFYSGLNAWVPLCDMNKANGCFQVAVGSHLGYNKVRGSNIEIDYPAEWQTPLTDLPMKAGDLLLFDQKLLHASPANLSGETRIAAGMALIPAEVEPLHYMYLHQEQKFYRLTMREDFLVETFFSKTDPQSLAKQMLDTCLDKVELPQLPAIEYKSKRKVFYGHNGEQEIADKGMVVMPLLSPEQIEQCLAVYKRTQSGMHDKFYNTIASNNLDYRKTVSDSLEEIFGDTLRAAFNRYKVLGYNFAAKSYGDGSVCHIHNDDSHADENLYTCINVWIPLVDVSADNGSLYVLPGSHKLPYSIRGIGLPFAYEKYKPVIEPRLKVMTMKAGEALFFDSRLIHGSYENTLQEDRPAIIVAMLPEEAEPLVYMKYRDELHNSAELFEAPPDFYLKIKIGERPVGYASRGLYRFSMADIEEEDFLEIINSSI